MVLLSGTLKSRTKMPDFLKGERPSVLASQVELPDEVANPTRRKGPDRASVAEVRRKPDTRRPFSMVSRRTPAYRLEKYDIQTGLKIHKQGAG
jgi:hypothetical protein